MENKFPVGTIVRYVRDCRLRGFEKGTIGVVVPFTKKGVDAENAERWKILGYLAVDHLSGTDSAMYYRTWMVSHPDDLEKVLTEKEIEDFL